MKTYFSLILTLLITINMSGQTFKEKMAAKKQAAKERVEQRKREVANINAKHEAEKALELNTEEIKNLSSLVSGAQDLMLRLESEDESYEETKAFYDSKDPKLFENLVNTFNQYNSNGRTSSILTSKAHIIQKQISEFLETKVYSLLNKKANNIDESIAQLNGYLSEEDLKEKAITKWKTLAVMTNFYQKVLPNDKQISGLNDQANSKVGSYQSAFEAKYAANQGTELHKKYREKVVLSQKPLVYGQESEADFLDDITIDGNNSGIYFMFYNNVPNRDYLKNSLGKKSEYVHAQLQFGSDIGSRLFNGCLVFYDKAYDLTDEEEQQAYLALPLVPDIKLYKRDKWLDNTYYRFLQCLVKLQLNKAHKARIAFGFPGTTKEFDKVFNLTITEDGQKQLKAMMEKIDHERLKDIRMGKPGAAHNTNNINIVKAAAAKKGFNVKRIVITGNSYKVFKNSKYPYEIKNKACSAELAYEENGKCYVYEFQIVQEYQGGGTYGQPFCAFDWGGKHQILCENVSK